MKKLSTISVIFISTGGMIGSGWLFSPYYGYQTAGGGVIFSWLITAMLTLFIAVCFAEVASMIPIVSGAMRFLRITHSRTLGFVFVVLSWKDGNFWEIFFQQKQWCGGINIALSSNAHGVIQIERKK